MNPSRRRTAFHLRGVGGHKARFSVLPLIVVLALLHAFVDRANTENKARRSYALPGQGVLVLDVPVSWKDEVGKASSEAPPTVTFRPPKGESFLVMVRIIQDPEGKKDFNSPETIRKLMDVDLEGIKPRAMEPDIRLQRLDGPTVRGYYFMATDKRPERGEFENLTRIGAGVGSLLVSVAVLTRERNSPVIEDVLAMVESARHEREKTPGKKTGTRP